jgi:Cd2+/Zn2+-exporting ATPase
MSSQIAGLGYAVTWSEEVGAKHAGHEVSAPEKDAGDSHLHDRGPAEQSWWQTRKGQLTIASGAALAVAFAVGKAAPAAEQWVFYW